MKLLKIKVDGLKLYEKSLEIDFLVSQKVFKDKVDNVFNIFKNSDSNNNIYTNNILSYIGINASSKSTTLKIISFILQMLEGNPLNKIKNKE